MIILCSEELQKSAAIVRITEDDIKALSDELRLKLTTEEAKAVYGRNRGILYKHHSINSLNQFSFTLFKKTIILICVYDNKISKKNI